MKVGDYVICRKSFCGTVRPNKLHKIKNISGTIAAIDDGAAEEKNVINFSEQRVYDSIRISFGKSWTTFFSPCKVEVTKCDSLIITLDGKEVANIALCDIDCLTVNPNSPTKLLYIKIGDSTT